MEAEREANDLPTVNGGAQNAKHGGDNATVLNRSFRNRNSQEITKPLK